jgi:hypothetical protein
MAGKDEAAGARARGDLEPWVVALAPSCEMGHGGACEVGLRLLRAELPVPALAAARRWEEWAARSRKTSLTVDMPGADDPAFWRGYLEERCELGDSMEACGRLSEDLQTEAPARSLAYLRRAKDLWASQVTGWIAQWERRCRSQDAFACLRLARALREGWAGEPEPARAAEVEQRGRELERAMRKAWGDSTIADDAIR